MNQKLHRHMAHQVQPLGLLQQEEVVMTRRRPLAMVLALALLMAYLTTSRIQHRRTLRPLCLSLASTAFRQLPR